MKLAYKVEIQPTTTQVQQLRQAAGNARWAWNWGLHRKIEAWRQRKAAIEAGASKQEAPKIPSAIDLHRELNVLKKVPIENGGVPWMYQATKCAPQESLRDLDVAFKHFFRRVGKGGPPGFPRFKRRGAGTGGFRVTGTIRVDERTITLPKMGRVRVKPGDHGYLPQGFHGTASVTYHADRWYVSVVGPDLDIAASNDGPAVGIDLGVARLATFDTGEWIENPRGRNRLRRRLRRAQRTLSRRQKGSRRRGKAKARLSRIHRQIANVRKDATHKATTRLAKSHSKVVIEDLRVGNMTRRAKGVGRKAKAGLNRSILDASFYEFRRQLEYKCPLYGSELVVVNPRHTSQRCSCCGHIAPENRLSQAVFHCVGCGYRTNADHNAAMNILVAGSCPETQNARGRDVRRVSASADARDPDEARIGSTKVTLQ